MRNRLPLASDGIGRPQWNGGAVTRGEGRISAGGWLPPAQSILRYLVQNKLHQAKTAAPGDGRSRTTEAGSVRTTVRLGRHKPPRAALASDLPNCSDAFLQYLSRHWITSFQLLNSSAGCHDQH